MPPLKPTLLILAAALVAGFVFNRASPNGIPLFGQWNPDQGTVHAGGEGSLVREDVEISVDRAYELWEAEESIFIDARAGHLYDEGHIPGAISLPVYEYYQREHLMEPYGADQHFVLYCGGADCLDSHRLRQVLELEGYRNLSVIGTGWPGWKARGFPSSTNTDTAQAP